MTDFFVDYVLCATGVRHIHKFLLMSVTSGISKECIHPIPSYGAAHKRHPVFVFASFAIRAKLHLLLDCIPKNCLDSL